MIFEKCYKITQTFIHFSSTTQFEQKIVCKTQVPVADQEQVRSFKVLSTPRREVGKKKKVARKKRQLVDQNV